MKKNFALIFFSLLLSLSLVYLLVFLWVSVFKVYKERNFFKNLDQSNYHEKYSNKVHHLKGKLPVSYKNNIIEKNGGTSEIAITPENTLHFKSECSLLDEETILATDNLIKSDFFNKKYRIIKVPKGEETGANCLRINEHLLIPKGYDRLLDLVSKDYKVRVLDVTEMEKVDAGLSCLSLRW